MNIAIWMAAGGLLGWLAYTYLEYNEARGMMISVIIGVAGGFLGGNIIAPMVSGPSPVPGDFSVSALLFAAAAAAALLFAGDQIEKRWSV